MHNAALAHSIPAIQRWLSLHFPNLWICRASVQWSPRTPVLLHFDSFYGVYAYHHR